MTGKAASVYALFDGDSSEMIHFCRAVLLED